MTSYSPTHVVVAVQRAKNLLSKGKNGTNDAYVTIALGKNKYQTSVKDDVIDPEWYEECDLPLPEKNYSEAKLTLQIYHRGKMGIDEFLGHLEIPLNEFDVYDAPRSSWYPLLCKPGQNKTNPRGELELRISFDVKQIKDFDTLSTTSGTSKRFKMKSSMSALGKKIKGKHEKTTDYIPDLTGLDTGALGIDDIAENYSAELANTSGGKKKVIADSLSLPPASPLFKRNVNVRGSKGLSPLPSHRKLTGDNSSQSSINTSTDDIKQKADEAEQANSPFTKTHRRVASGSESTGKPPKPNRRLLQSKVQSQSVFDVSLSGKEFDVVPDKVSLDDSMKRTSISGSDVAYETKDVNPNKSITQNKRLSTGSTAKANEKAVLVDDDSDSSEDYKPSPIAPIKIKTEEPTDIFSKISAQMQKEEPDNFKLAKHSVMPGEEVFSPVGNFQKTMPSTPFGASTPVGTEVITTINSKDKSSKKMESKATPPSVFDVLMAIDEPEYNVDDSVADDPDAKTEDGLRPKELNPFDTSVSESGIPVIKLNSDSFNDSKLSPSGAPINPFDGRKNSSDTAAASVPGSTRNSSVSNGNPFDSRKDSSDISSSPVPGSTQNSSVSNGNPFDGTKYSLDFSSASLPSSAQNSNMNDKIPSEPSKALKISETNPFEVLSNPFATSYEEKGIVSVKNPFEESDSLESSTNPFEAGDNNPFNDEDEDDLVKHKRLGSGTFQRSGSSRFSNKNRTKPKQKGTAPSPPSTLTSATGEPKGSASTGLIENIQKARANTSPMFEKVKQSNNLNSTQSHSSTTKVEISNTTEEVKRGSKKDKKAPTVPLSSAVDQPKAETELLRQRSVSHNAAVKTETVVSDSKQRSDSSIARIEVDMNSKKERFDHTKTERQPAIGAEAPERPKDAIVTDSVAVQVALDVDETLPEEFRRMSKHNLVEVIQKLKQQLRKKDDHVKDLEEYIDSLLLRVMTADPDLLVTQSKQVKSAAKLR